MVNTPQLPVDIPVGSILAEYVYRRFGAKVRTLAPVGIGVNSSGVQLAKNNPRRLLLSISSTDATQVKFGYLPNVAFYQPFMLPPNGGGAIFTPDEDGEMVGYDWYGIVSSGASTVYIVEVEAI